MNIAMFTDTYKPQINGVVTSIDIFKRELESMGHKVYIFAPMFPGEKKISRRVLRFNSMAVPIEAAKEQRLIFPYSRVLNKLKKLKIDLVHAQTPFSMGMLALFLSKKNKIPLVHTYHTLFTEYLHYIKLPSSGFENVAITASKLFCNKCDIVISPSEQIKKELIDYGIKPEIDVIPTGIDLSSAHTLDGLAIEDIKKELEIPKGKKILTFVGRLGKEKSVDFLLEAYVDILKSNPDTSLLIIGDGPYRVELENLSKKLEIYDDVIFKGYQKREDVFKYLKASDLFVFASTTETQGLAILEAMAASTAVVAVDAMGVSDVLMGNQGGYLVKNDQETFSTQVIELLNDPTLLEEKSKAAYLRATQLSSQKMTERLISCYNKVLS